MVRRLALLDDNQEILERRLSVLGTTLPPLVEARICAIAVIGSVAEGRARDDSDLDLLLVLHEGSPRRADYAWWDERVEPRLPDASGVRFPLQPVIVGRDSLATSEPNLRAALESALPLWDPEGVLP